MDKLKMHTQDNVKDTYRPDRGALPECPDRNDQRRQSGAGD